MSHAELTTRHAELIRDIGLAFPAEAATDIERAAWALAFYPNDWKSWLYSLGDHETAAIRASAMKARRIAGGFLAAQVQAEAA